MFKNLKKKIEEVGGDLSTLAASSSTLGSSLSSLKKSESKSSTINGSRESLQSDSSHTRTIRTSSIVEDDAFSAAPSGSEKSSKDRDSISADFSKIVGALTAVQETFSNDNFVLLSPAAQPLHSVTSFPSIDEIIIEPQYEDRNSPELLQKGFSVQDSMDSSSVMSLVDEDVSSDSCPVLVPIQREASPKPDISHEIAEAAQKLAGAAEQLKQRETEIVALKSQITSRDIENLSLKTEVDRYKDLSTKLRTTEDKLAETNRKAAESQKQIASSKLESDSWKIAHDQALQRLKEHDAATATANKKYVDMEAKFNNMKSMLEDRQKEVDKFREENSSVRSTVSLLEGQLDKLLNDYRTEKSQKEVALGEVKDLMRLREVVVEQTQEIGRLKDEHERDVARIRQDKEQDLARIRQAMDETSKRSRLEADKKTDLSLTQLKEKERLLETFQQDLQDREQRVGELQSLNENLQVRVSSLEQDLEGKESNLAIFRRRAAKETETKLRERDKQIATLERQVEELSQQTSSAKSQEHLDETSHQYMKNVILKFLAAASDERMQMLRAVSVLLKLSHVEEEWLRDTLAWKQQWLPGPRPELPTDHYPPHPHASNGHS